MGKGNPDLVKMIVEDVEDSVKEAQKKIDKITLTVPDIAKKRTPLVLEYNGKTTIHGETNPRISFTNNNRKGD